MALYKDHWSQWHLFGTICLCFIIAIFINHTIIAMAIALALGILWEIGDSFKPHYTQGYTQPKIIQWLFFSDGFSLHDICMDLIGVWVFFILRVIWQIIKRGV